jgi:dienelactone hydrolase
MKHLFLVGLCVTVLTSRAMAQQPVSFPLLDESGQMGQSPQIHGDLYGHGARGVVLAHGGRFNKESWKAQAEALADAGFRVLAVQFRGDGPNPDGSPGSFGSDADNAADVLAAVAYLHRSGAKSVSAVGGSFGGDAVGNADAQSKPGNLDRIVLLASSGGDAPEKLNGRKLFIVARDDSNSDGLRLPEIRKHYEKAPQPKKLVVLEGSAHAQFLFGTDQGPRVFNEILQFLSEP